MQWHIDIIYGLGFTLINGKLIQLSTAQIVELADLYGLNDIRVDGTTLYCAIIILHGGDNPTTFARIQLIPSPLSTCSCYP